MCQLDGALNCSYITFLQRDVLLPVTKNSMPIRCCAIFIFKKPFKSAHTVARCAHCNIVSKFKLSNMNVIFVILIYSRLLSFSI